MKFALFTQSMDFGAFSTVFSGLANALAENGVTEIDLLTLAGDIRDSEHAFPPHSRSVPIAARGSAGAVPPLRHYLEQAQPDVLISGPILPNLAACTAKVLARRWHGILILGHHHPIRLARGQTWQNNEHLVRLLYRFADASYSTSPWTREEAIELAHLDPARVACIPNALPPSSPDLSHECDHPWFREERPGGPLFVTVSRLEPVKNVSLLIDAFSLIADQIDAKLLVVGSGVLQDELQAQIRSAGLDTRVSLLGYVPTPRPYLRAADAFVLASNEEGFGQVLSEAMGEGLPVISTDAAGGGPRFVLDDGRAGLLVPRGDRAALANAMAQMEDPELRKRYASLSLERAERFTPGRVGEDLLAFIESLPRPGANQ